MNSIHRFGILIAMLAALLTIGAAFVVRGYLTAQTAAAVPVATTQAPAPTDTATPTPDPSLDPQVIYVLPPGTAAVVTVTPQPAPPVVVVPPAGPNPTPPVIHITVSAPPGSGDDGPGDN